MAALAVKERTSATGALDAPLRARHYCTETLHTRLLRHVAMNHELITTAFELPNHRIVRTLGVVRGITVRSRSVLGTIGATLQTLRGGNITLLTELCEKSREEAFEIMVRHAVDVGATGIIAVRYDATEIMSGVSEVLCYGTAVVVEPA
jgi:uncharacterized protein YbjQ (UPF0145 family)